MSRVLSKNLEKVKSLGCGSVTSERIPARDLSIEKTRRGRNSAHHQVERDLVLIVEISASDSDCFVVDVDGCWRGETSARISPPASVKRSVEARTR